MTTLDKMLVRGIRSFSDQEDAVIEFKGKPLTVISGMNGCGKTTLIECLKFATTGVLPPNCSNGQSFVRDPAFVGNSEVKASVKLLLRTREKKRLLVTRNLRVLKRKTRLEFKQLEGMLKSRDENGKDQALSGKCAQLDELVPKYMTVSKAVLESVVFCHQEDSTWPLQESSTLKKKFDDIFESARYNKALEDIKKQRKRLVDKYKALDSDMKVLDVHRAQSRKLRAEERSVRDETAGFQDLSDGYKRDIERATELAHQAQEFLDAHEDDLRKLEYAEMRVSEAKSTMQTLRDELLQRYGKQEFEAMVDNGPREEMLGRMLQQAEEAAASCQESNDALSAAVKRSEDLAAELRKLEEKINKKELAKSSAVGQLRAGVERETKVMEDLLAFHRSSKLGDPEAGRLLEEQIADTTAQRAGTPARSKALRASLEAIRKALAGAEAELAEGQAAHDAAVEAKRGEVSSLQAKKEVAQEQARQAVEKLAAHEERLRELTSKQSRAAPGSADFEQGIQRDLDLKRAARDKAREELSVEEDGGGDASEAVQREQGEVQAELTKLDEEVAALEDKQEHVLHFRASLKALSEWHSEQRLRVDDLVSACDKLEDGGLASNLQRLAELSRVDELGPIEQAKRIVEEQEDIVKKALDDIEASAGAAQTGYDEQQALLRKTEKDSFEAESSVSLLASQIAKVEKTMRKLPKVEMDLPKKAKEVYDAQGPDVKVELMRAALEKDVDDLRANIKIQSLKKELLETQIYLVSQQGDLEQDQLHCPICSRDIESGFPFDVAKHPMHTDPKHIKHAEEFLDRNRVVKDFAYEGLHPSGKELVVKFKKDETLSGSRMFLASLVISHTVMERRGERKLQDTQSLLDEAKDDLRNFSAFERELLECRDAKIEHEKLQSKLDEAKAKRDALDAKAPEYREEAARRESTMENLASARQAAEALITAFAQCAKIFEEASRRMARLDLGPEEAERLEASLSASGADGRETSPLEAARQRRRDADARLKALQVKREETLNMQAARQRELQKLTDDIIKLESDLADIQKRQSEMKEVRAERERLLSERGALDTARSAARRSLAEMERQLKDAERAFEKLRRADDDALGAQREVVEAARKVVLVASTERQALEASGTPDLDLDAMEQVLAGLYSERLHLNAESKSERDTIKVTKEGVRRSEAQQAKCKDVIQLLQHRERVNELKAERRELKNRIGGTTNLEGTREELRARQGEAEQARMKLAKLEGKRLTLQDRLDKVQEDLAHKDYHNVEARYSEVNVKCQTTKRAASDLDSYYTALDTALMQFHQEKIEQINNKIRDLWKLVYTGGDVDKIELCSERSTTARSRSFNYRVIMTKGDSRLDMRGRCSAGQKMLASLVIRMALAETFCVDCGILVLDEPTTNLDVNNKLGLASALHDLLKSYNQSRFQLIVITHDEEFVSKLNDKVSATDLSGNFYKVSRELDHEGQYVSRVALMNPN